MSLTSYRAAPPCVTGFDLGEVVWKMDFLRWSFFVLVVFVCFPERLFLKPAGLAAAYFPEA